MRLQYTKFLYSFKVIVHQFFFSGLILFPDNSYSIHLTGLKYGGQLDYAADIFSRLQYTKFSYSYNSLKIVQAGFHFQLTPIVFI